MVLPRENVQERRDRTEHKMNINSQEMNLNAARMFINFFNDPCVHAEKWRYP